MFLHLTCKNILKYCYSIYFLIIVFFFLLALFFCCVWQWKALLARALLFSFLFQYFLMTNWSLQKVLQWIPLYLPPKFYKMNTHTFISLPIILFLSFFLFFFKVRMCGIWKFSGQGSNRSCSCQSTPQPQQCWILNPLSEARYQTRVLMDTSQVRYCWAMMGTLVYLAS